MLHLNHQSFQYVWTAKHLCRVWHTQDLGLCKCGTVVVQGNDLQLDMHDANEPNILEPQHLPDTEALAEGFRGCLQVSYLCLTTANAVHAGRVCCSTDPVVVTSIDQCGGADAIWPTHNLMIAKSTQSCIMHFTF